MKQIPQLGEIKSVKKRQYTGPALQANITVGTNHSTSKILPE